MKCDEFKNNDYFEKKKRPCDVVGDSVRLKSQTRFALERNASRVILKGQHVSFRHSPTSSNFSFPESRSPFSPPVFSYNIYIITKPDDCSRKLIQNFIFIPKFDIPCSVFIHGIMARLQRRKVCSVPTSVESEDKSARYLD